jgi:hypothetical protein
MSYLVCWSAVTVVILAVPITFTTRTMLRLFNKESKGKLVGFFGRFPTPDEVGVGSVKSQLPFNVIDPLSLL